MLYRQIRLGLGPASLLLVLMLSALTLAAQNYSVIHSFTGAADGAFPLTGVTISPAGQIYGTTRLGHSYGNVYTLKNSGGTWTVTNLYAFKGGTDGQAPLANVILSSRGTLFGTTSQGGDQNCYGFGCGTVFELQPQPHFLVTSGNWKETQLTHFEGLSDGANPVGNLTFDADGNLYGAAACEYNNCPGIIFKLTPSGGSWTRSIIYSFAGGNDGSQPLGGITFGPDGNLYGVTLQGGVSNNGTVFELIRSGNSWTKTTLHNFASSEGTNPFGGLYIDASGTLYGTTTTAGPHSVGSFFTMSPDGHGGWTFTTPYAFSCGGCYTSNYPGPQAALTPDSAGNLYGTAYETGPYGQGSVFKLSPNGDGSWSYTSLHDFTGGTDGGIPVSSVAIDAAGNLYGTAQSGGRYYDGAIWQITP